MGQYYYVINTTKRQYLHPHRFGDGLKLLEFGCSGCSTMTALAILLADGNGRGGGDLRSDDPIVGSWAGDQIVIGGDYADPGRFVPEADMAAYREAEKGDGDEAPTLHAVASALYEEISAKVLPAMKSDSYIAKSLAK